MPFPAQTTASSGKRAVDQKDHSEPRNGVPRATVSSTVAKAIGIVDILASKGETGINLAELSVLIEMPKSSTHRYMATLQELGLAERKDGDRYCLGTKVIELAGSFLTKSDLRNESQVIMEELAEMTGETVLAVPSGTEVVYIAKIESRYADNVIPYWFRQLMYCVLGKASAFSKPKLVHSIWQEGCRRAPPHHFDRALRAELVTSLAGFCFWIKRTNLASAVLARRCSIIPDCHCSDQHLGPCDEKRWIAPLNWDTFSQSTSI
jgi:hypothetical protein